MQHLVEGSESAEEALLKRCAQFNMSKSSMTALETCDLIVQHRKEELADCTKELMESIAAALRQRNLILKHDSGWRDMTLSGKGEVPDML